MLPTPLLPLGDSMTLGFNSTAAVQSGGYRWLLEQALAAYGLPTKFDGSQITGSFANNWHEGYNGASVNTIAANSDATRTLMQPGGVLLLAGINDLIAGAVSLLVPRYTALLNGVFDRAAHAIPGGGNTVKWVLVSTLMRYPLDPVTVGPRVVDFNRNFLPDIVKAQQALGRNISIVDGYSAVTSIGGDGIHPDDVGYAQLAGAWLPAVIAKQSAAA